MVLYLCACMPFSCVGLEGSLPLHCPAWFFGFPVQSTRFSFCSFVVRRLPKVLEEAIKMLPKVLDLKGFRKPFRRPLNDKKATTNNNYTEG